ncbi:MAG TPA: hypothetical protein PLT70_06175 [bacterium]|nr:hypothetical protein [bacterium]HQN73423.1 hypothetical protein [bacterium]
MTNIRQSVFNLYEKKTRDWLQLNLRNKIHFQKSLKSSFEYLRAFHATKIYPFDDFKKGLSPADEKILKNRALKLFTSADKTKNEKILEIIDEFKVIEKGCLHYCLNKENYSEAYHYLLFGSEDLMRVADKIQADVSGFSGRDILVKKGTSVIIHFNIPIIDISPDEFKEIFGCLNNYDSKVIHECRLDESFIHRSLINAENIVKFEKIKSVENKYNMPVY